jgi:hypothetical protein
MFTICYLILAGVFWVYLLMDWYRRRTAGTGDGTFRLRVGASRSGRGRGLRKQYRSENQMLNAEC